MSINALVLGTLLTQPTQRTSQRGANFTTCRIRVASAGTGDTDSVVANAIAFDQDVQRELLSLGTGEQVAASGTLKGVVSENGSQSTLSRFGAVEQFLSVRPKCTRWGDVPVQGLPRDAELLA